MKKCSLAVLMAGLSVLAGAIIMLAPYALQIKVKTMSNIDIFVNQENAATQGRGANGINTEVNAAGSAAAGANLGTITPTAGTNAVIGFQSAVFNGGYDVVLLDGPRANYSIQVNASDVTTIKDIGTGDATYGQTVTVSGANYIIFNGTHISLSDSQSVASTTNNSYGVLNYPNDLYYITSQANAQLAQFYAATLPWEPQIALPGFEYWEARLVQGMPLTAIAQSFINTQYFQQHFGDPGTTHAQHQSFVLSLYANILGMTLDTSNSGVQYWITQMDNVANTGMDGAHALVSFTNATSNNNVINAIAGSTPGAGTGWLINYFLTGGYADPGVQQSVQTVFQNAEQTNYLNTGLIDPSSLSSLPNGLYTNTNGNAVRLPQVINGVAAGQTTVFVGTQNTTVALSTGINEGFVAGTGDTIIGCTTGNSWIGFTGSNVTAILHGAGNTIQSSPSSSSIQHLNNTVTGYAVGSDYINIAVSQPSTSTQAITILTPTSSAPVQGTSLNFSTHQYYVNVGTLADTSAATMATAANAIYTVSNYGGGLDQPGENIVFFGQVGGDTVLYTWGLSSSDALHGVGANVHANHLVNADEFTVGITLVGVQASRLATTDFTYH